MDELQMSFLRNNIVIWAISSRHSESGHKKQSRIQFTIIKSSLMVKH